MENAVIANNVWDLVRNLDLDIQFDLWEKLSKVFSKSKTADTTSHKDHVLSDKEKLGIFNDCVGSWDWPEDEYPTDQFIADIRGGNWDEYNDRITKMIEENEEVFVGH